MPRGYFRQYPAPSDFGFEENQPVPLHVLVRAMVRTWFNRLRAIFAPYPTMPDENADDQTAA